MVKLYRNCVAVTALAAILSLATVTSGYAAQHRTRDTGRSTAASSNKHLSNLYNYAPGGPPGAGPNFGTALGPPDPASCGGFRC